MISVNFAGATVSPYRWMSVFSLTIPCSLVSAQALSVEPTSSTVEEIVVIGSRITRRDFTSPSPISTLDHDALQFSVQPTLEESLNRMPQVTPDFDRTANNPGDGTARVNLRGLGSGRTLVLLNGRRVAPSGVSSSVDLNNIPRALVDRIEVITGGATTVYGSDAIAGVVNFVTRDDLEGWALDTSFYTTEQGDSNVLDGNITFGQSFAGGRGNFAAFAGVLDRDAILAGDRPFTAITWADFDGVIEQSGNNRVPAGAVLFPLADLGNGLTRFAFDPDGNPIPFREPEDRYETAPPAYLQTPLRRYSGGLFLDFDFRESQQGYLEISHTRNEASQRLSPVGIGGFYDTNVDNPVLTPQTQQVFADYMLPAGPNTVSYFLGRRLIEIGDRIIENARDYTRVAVGVRGQLSTNWNYDAWVTYTRSDDETLFINDASDSRLRQGLLVDPTTGQCFDPLNGCVPVDLFGAGRISDDAAAYIRYAPFVNETSREQKLVSAFVSGSPFRNWAGDVDFAFGVEWRGDTGRFTADDALFLGDSLGYRGNSAVDGTEEVAEVYGEFLVPLLQDRQFARYLAIEAGARFSDYKSAGTTDAYKLGGDWIPVDGIRFRTMYQKSARAPSVLEAFQDQFTEFGFYVGNDSGQDPCSASTDPIGNGRLQQCVATGLPADQVGVFEATIAAPTNFIRGGNPDLEPETAKTFTVGVVVDPLMDSLANRDLTVSIDYFDLEVEDTIGILSPTIACFDPLNVDARFCDAIRRNESGFDVNEVVETYFNRGTLKTSGFDTQISYQSDLPLWASLGTDSASLSADLVWTHVLDNTIQETPTATKLRCGGHFGAPCNTLADGVTYPEDRISLRTSYRSGDLGLHLGWQWISGTDNARLLESDFLGGAAPQLAIPSVGSKSYLDGGVSYDFSSHVGVRLNVSNLLDTDPPFMADAVIANNTDTRLFDVFGRSYSLTLGMRY